MTGMTLNLRARKENARGFAKCKCILFYVHVIYSANLHSNISTVLIVFILYSFFTL